MCNCYINTISKHSSSGSSMLCVYHNKRHISINIVALNVTDANVNKLENCITFNADYWVCNTNILPKKIIIILFINKFKAQIDLTLLIGGFILRYLVKTHFQKEHVWSITAPYVFLFIYHFKIIVLVNRSDWCCDCMSSNPIFFHVVWLWVAKVTGTLYCLQGPHSPH